MIELKEGEPFKRDFKYGLAKGRVIDNEGDKDPDGGHRGGSV